MWWIGPTYPVAAIGWRLLKKLTIPLNLKKNEAERRIEFPGGGEIWVKSADNPDSLRGEGLDLAIFDECAFIKENAWIDSIRPALTDTKGDAVFISTPSGQNWFYKLWRRAQEDEDWQAWHYPSVSNPFLDPEEINQAEKELPNRTFRQEYLAEFIKHEGAVFQQIGKALYTPEVDELNRHKGHSKFGGLDWGKHVDYTALSIFCATCSKEVFKLRIQGDYLFQIPRIKDACSKTKPEILLVELNSAEANFELLQEEGLPVQGFRTKASNKPLIIRNFATSLEKHELKIISDPIWTGELEAFEQKVNPNTGRSTYSAPEGLHDDTVIARCLAWWACTNSGGFELVLL